MTANNSGSVHARVAKGWYACAYALKLGTLYSLILRRVGVLVAAFGTYQAVKMYLDDRRREAYKVELEEERVRGGPRQKRPPPFSYDGTAGDEDVHDQRTTAHRQ